MVRGASGVPEVMRTPRAVDVEITARCNLRCRYCYFFDNPAVRYADLGAKAWERFFDELGACAVMNVCLSGGEPFLRPDLPLLVKSIVANRMRFSILSNGSLIDDARAAFLAGTNRCDYVQVSLDGSTPASHDACRGAGSFEGAVRGIRALQRQGVSVAVRLTIHHDNVHDLEAAARFILEDLGLPGFGTNAVCSIGTCRQRGTGLLLSSAERSRAMETLLRLAQRYPRRITAQAGPLAEAVTWQSMERARSRHAAPFPCGGRLTGCGCTFSKLAVRPDGAYVPCQMLAHVELGRINRDSLTTVWRDSEPLKRLRMRSRIPLKHFAFCRDCAYIPYCTGNCPGVACALTGKINHPSPNACYRDFLRSGGRIPRGATA